MLADRSPQQNGIARTGSYRREKLLCTLSSRIWASRSLSSGLIEVIFVPNGTIGRTTSGKVQRMATKGRFERGELLAAVGMRHGA